MLTNQRPRSTLLNAQRSPPPHALSVRNRTNGFTSCFLGGMVFRFCGIGKTFHESENPVSLFETGTLIRFLASQLTAALSLRRASEAAAGLPAFLACSSLMSASTWATPWDKSLI